MAVEIFHYDHIPQDKLVPAMKFLLTKWNTLSVMNRLALQAVTEDAIYNIPDNSAYMVTAGDDFYFMHVGANVRAAIGDNHTGKLLSTVPTAIAHDLRDAYQQAVAQRKPLFMRFTSPVAQNALVWERLVLPLPVDRLGTVLVCYSEVLTHHQGVFEYLFKSARYPWVITYPIFNPDQQLDDGWVLLMNDAAHVVFRRQRPVGNLRLRELALFQVGELWGKLREHYVAANPRSRLWYDRLELELVRLNNLVAYRFDTSVASAATAETLSGHAAE
jgi:hypothetical protein